ncbi:hypothetical protein C8R44DRAFT_582075, partial [Mycena epipterygia]
FEQFFPRIHANIAAKVSELVRRDIVAPAFQNSVFTTAEISFCDAPSLSQKGLDNIFYAMDAITTCGDYAWRERGSLILWDDHKVLCMPPGSTVLFPSGSKRYSFVAVAPHETRYLFRQSCNAGALRWVDKGFRSNKTFMRTATPHEQAG